MTLAAPAAREVPHSASRCNPAVVGTAAAATAEQSIAVSQCMNLLLCILSMRQCKQQAMNGAELCSAVEAALLACTGKNTAAVHCLTIAGSTALSAHETLETLQQQCSYCKCTTNQLPSPGVCVATAHRYACNSCSCNASHLQGRHLPLRTLLSSLYCSSPGAGTMGTAAGTPPLLLCCAPLCLVCCLAAAAAVHARCAHSLRSAPPPCLQASEHQTLTKHVKVRLNLQTACMHEWLLTCCRSNAHLSHSPSAALEPCPLQGLCACHPCKPPHKQRRYAEVAEMAIKHPKPCAARHLLPSLAPSWMWLCSSSCADPNRSSMFSVIYGHASLIDAFC
jgi:hypothetical protein